MPPASRQLPAVRLAREAHALAEQLAIDLTPGAGRRLAITEVVAASIRIASRDRDGLLDELAGKEVPS